MSSYVEAQYQTQSPIKSVCS